MLDARICQAMLSRPLLLFGGVTQREAAALKISQSQPIFVPFRVKISFEKDFFRLFILHLIFVQAFALHRSLLMYI